MRKSLWKILIFLVVLIVADRITGWYLGTLYEKNTCLHSGGELNNYLKHGKADILFLGSSRVNTMIDPEIISPNALNVSQPGKHFYYHLAVADLIDQHGKMPSNMLVINIETEDVYLESEEKLIEDVFYLKYYYGQNQFITHLIQQKGMYERFKFLSSAYRFNGENFRLLTNPWQKICVPPGKGYFPLEKSNRDSLRLQHAIEILKKKKTNEQANPDFFKKLDRLVYLCEKNNTRLVLLNGPNYYYPESRIKASKLIQSYCVDHQVDYLDFNNQVTVFDNLSMWCDHLHLNKEGSLLYSKMIRSELDKLED